MASERRQFIAILLGMTAVKLWLAAVWGGTADILHMRMAAEAFLSGHDVLEPSNMGFAPSFFPLGHYLLAAGSLALSRATGVPFMFLVKVPAVLADLGIAWLLLAMPRAGARAALIYMANPITLLLSSYHGQFHTVAVAGTAASLWLAEQGSCRWSGVALGLAASVRQHFAVLIVPLLRKAAAGRRALLAGFVLTVIPMNIWLLGSAHPDRVFAPTWTYGSWGYTMLLVQGPRVLRLLGVERLASAVTALNGLLEAHGTAVCWIWAVVFAVWAWRQGPNLDLWHAAVLFPLGLCAVTPGFGVQWLVWALPFWLIVHRRRAEIYCVLVSLFLMGSYWQWQLPVKYGVRSITANLSLLSPFDLAGLIGVGAVGLLTWAYCAISAWQLMRRPA